MIALCSSQKCAGYTTSRPVEKPGVPITKDNCPDCGQALRWVKQRNDKIHNAKIKPKINLNKSLFGDV